MREVNEGMRAMSEVANEDPRDSNGAEKSANFGEVLAGSPILDDRDSRLVWKSSFGCAAMANDHDFASADDGLGSREGAAGVLDALDDAIHVVEVLPHKSSNAGVLQYGLVLAIVIAIVAFWSFASAVVDAWYCEIGDFRLKDIGDIVVEDGYHVAPTHRQGA